MPSPRFLIIPLCLLLSLSHAALKAQCISSPAYPDCTGTETLATDGEVVNSGSMRWYYGSPASFNYLKLNGGTLVVCGDLLVDKFEMDSGTVFVRPGAHFTIGNGIGYGLVLKGNSALYNAGTLEIIRNLSFDNGYASAAQPNILINDAGGILKMNNQYFVINNAWSWFVNHGQAYFHGLVTDNQSSAGSVCLGNLSETQMTVLYNKVKNAYVAPDGPACVSVSEFTQLWDTLSNNASINMCLSAAHKVDSSCMPWGCKPGAWGQVNLFTGCNGCIEIKVLSMRFLSFSVTEQPAGHLLQWEMTGAADDFRFAVEWSANGKSYETLPLQAQYNGLTRKFVAMDVFDPQRASGFYRVLASSRYNASEIRSRSIQVESNVSTALVFPNPFRDRLTLVLPRNEKPLEISLSNLKASRVWQYSDIQEDWKGVLSLPPTLAPGIYILRVTSASQSRVFRVIKE